MPPGIFGVASSSISPPGRRASSTPSAMHMRFIEPNRLTATGMSKPVGPLEQQRRPAARRLRHAVGDRADLEIGADRLARSRASSRSLSSAAMNSFRSLNILLTTLFRACSVSSFVRPCRQPSPSSPQSPAPAPARGGRASPSTSGARAVADRGDEVRQLAPQRLVALDRQLAALDVRPLAVTAHQPPALDFLRRVVDRDDRRRAGRTGSCARGRG